ncbi:MAG: hypothetical protein FJ246_03065 [Nitrospira sp.]|nr:hypothetical protein [Nitrospira sp.]
MAMVLVLALTQVTVMQTVWAQEAEAKSQAVTNEESSATGAGLQAGSFVLTLVYTPLKLAFAVLGGVTGGLTYVFSGGDTDAALSVWGTSMYGTYLITPDHLKGDKAVRFLGVPPGKEGNEAPAK